MMDLFHHKYISKLPFAPTQNLEYCLGFDGAYHLDQPLFGSFLPGICLDEQAFKECLEIAHRKMPDYICHTFLQFKRPSCMKISTAKEWNSWGKEYFRFRTDLEQQHVLEKIESLWGNQVLTGYVCPAIEGFDNLKMATESHEVIEKSRFVLPSQMKGHRVFSYVDASSAGKVHSEVEEVNPSSFQEKLNQVREENRPQNVVEIVEKISSQIAIATRKWDSDAYLPFERWSEFEVLRERFTSNYDEDEYLNALGTILAFEKAFDMKVHLFR
jgi:hypothetical protein